MTIASPPLRRVTDTAPLSRAEWLATLSRTSAEDLVRVAAPVLADYRFEPLRSPESGLVMVRARIGNQGDRFNLGEATVSRCAVRYVARDGTATAGVGYVLGRDEARAMHIAQLDALLQCPALQPVLLGAVVEPLREAVAQRQRLQRERTEASRVRFFTLQTEAA